MNSKRVKMLKPKSVPYFVSQLKKQKSFEKKKLVNYTLGK